MVRVLEKFLRHQPHKLVLDRAHRSAGREAGAVGDAKNMGIDRDGGFAECRVQNDVCGFYADPRQLLELLTRRRHRAGVPLE